jgi:hypothetical protein
MHQEARSQTPVTPCAKQYQLRLQLDNDALKDQQRKDNEQQQEKREVGCRPHIQFLQQHTNSHNRHFRRRNNSQNVRRNVCEGRQTGVFTIRCNARGHGRSRRSQRQGNNSHTHQGKSTRRVRTEDSWARSTSGYQGAGKSRIPHRTHRRDYSCPA